MAKNTKILIVLTIVLLNTLFSSYASAGLYDWLASKDQTDTILVSPLITDSKGVSFEKIFWSPKSSENSKVISEEPKIEYEVIRESVRQVTAYNVGDVYQTDSTPCTGAYSKVNLCEEVAKGTRICAANFVPLETKLRISIGDESFECIVWDRMHSRFQSRVDIAMSASEKIQARQFGLQKLKVQILKEVENLDTSI